METFFRNELNDKYFEKDKICWFTGLPEPATGGVLQKQNVFLKIQSTPLENTCVGVSL